MATTIIIDVPLDEGKDALLSATSDLGTPGSPVLRASRPISIHHGMGKGERNWQFANFRNRLYVTNNESRPRVWDGDVASKSSLSPPSGTMRTSVERKKVRVSDEGAAYPDVIFGPVAPAGSGVCRLTSAGAPFEQITVLDSCWTPTASDVGKIIVIPTCRVFGDLGAPVTDGPSYIGQIKDVQSATVFTVDPPYDGTVQSPPVATDVVFMVFDAEDIDDIAESTPYGDRRLIPSGANEPWDTASDGDWNCSPGKSNKYSLGFAGSHGLVVDGIQFKDLSDEELKIGPDTVIDFKCYLRAERLETGLGGRITLWERRNDPDTGSWELAIVENGKVRFRFYDTKKEDWRSIQTCGRVLTTGEWYYFRFRYKYKRSGGWEPDDRWMQRQSTSPPILGRYRDSLAAWACEGKNPADPLLVVPGCHNSFDLNQGLSDANMRVNKSHNPEGTAYLKSSPWIGPRYGSNRFYWPVGWQDQPSVAYNLRFDSTAAGNAAGPDVGHQIFACTMRLAGNNGPNITLPRWFSRNRDIGIPTQAVDGEICDNDIGGTGTNYYPAADRAAGHLAAGIQRGAERAVLCYVYGRDGQAERFASQRILAVRDIDNYDIGNSDNADVGSESCQLYLTDDPALGADGLGTINITTFPADYVVAFCLPNGENHSENATGNKTPLPTLMVQGENPVGSDDSPDDADAPIRMFGSAGSDKPENAALGFDGQFDDVGFKVSEVSAISNTDEYTPDMMMPDPLFSGPVDTRIFSLPPLQFDTSATSQPFPQDDYDIIPAGSGAGDPDWCSRLDEPTTGPDIDAEIGDMAASVVQDGYKVPRRGKHLMAVTFYDPDQDVESPPSEIAELLVEAEEGADGTPDPMDASFRLVADIVPLCGDRDRPRLWRRIYQSLAGGSVLFLSAELKDNRTSQVDVNPSLTWLPFQPTLDWLRAEPPVCRSMIATEGRMIYGGLREAPQAIAWSDGFKPWSVLRTSREVCESRDGSPVTALGYLLGRTFVFQRDATFSLDFALVGVREAARLRRIQSNTGAVGPTAVVEFDDALFFRAEKGIYMVDTSLRSVYVSPMMEGAFRDLDAEALSSIAGCYDRSRNQVLFTSQESALSFPKRIYTFEVTDTPYSRQQIPVGSLLSHQEGITALLSGDDPGTEQQQVYAGTMQGFVTKLDQEGAIRCGESGFGDQTASVIGVSGAQVVIQKTGSLSLDPTGDGIVGMPVLFTRDTTLTLADGTTETVERPVAEGTVVRVETVSGTQARLYLAEAASGLVATDGVYLGGWVRRWQSKIFGMEKFVRTQRSHLLDLFFDEEIGGYIQLAIYLDRASTPNDISLVEMDDGERLMSTPYRSVFFQFEVSRHGHLVPLHIHLLGYRALLETQHG